MKSQPFLLATLTLAVNALFGADSGYYVEADIRGFAMQPTKIVMPAEARDSLATDMIKYLKSLPADKQIAQAPKMIAMARFLSPKNRDAIILIGQHRRKYTPLKEDAEAKKNLIDRLTKCAKRLLATRNSDNKTLGAYFYNLVLLIDPDNRDVNYTYEVKKLRTKANWEGVFKNGIPGELITTQPGSDIGIQSTGRVIKKGWVKGYITKPKEFAFYQSKVKGLFVTVTDNGFHGTAMDIIATVSLNEQLDASVMGSKGICTTFARGRSIGAEMKKASDEAFRAAKARYPVWPQSIITYSFRDKYTPKDGGSAGTAFSPLLLSLLDGIELRRDCAITGDISVDWQVLRVGAVIAKIKGARDADLQGVAIPAANQRAVYDMVALGSLDDLWKIHIFQVKDLSEAIETMRVDQSEERKRGLKLFAKVQDYLKRKGKSGLTRSVHKALLSVLNDVPNSLSAKVLAEVYEGKLQHKELSLSYSIEHLFISCNAIMPLFVPGQPVKQGAQRPVKQRAQRNVSQVDIQLAHTTKADIKNARDRMRQLQGKMSRDVKPLYEDFDRLLRKVESYMKFRETTKPTSRPFVELKEKTLPKMVADIRKEVKRLGKDEDFLKRLEQGK